MPLCPFGTSTGDRWSAPDAGGAVAKGPILDEAIQNWRTAKTGEQPKVEGSQHWMRGCF